MEGGLHAGKERWLNKNIRIYIFYFKVKNLFGPFDTSSHSCGTIIEISVSPSAHMHDFIIVGRKSNKTWY